MRGGEEHLLPSTRKAVAGEPQGQGQSETHSEAPAHTPNERGKWVGGWDGFCVETSQCRLHTFLVVGMTDRQGSARLPDRKFRTICSFSEIHLPHSC